MIVKGDGSLINAQVALEYPVETILSGPAASVVGAGFLPGLSDFLVSDMGGTTTDCAVVRAGKPAINDEGALIGGWRTMVEAVDVRTVGLGGDSVVSVDRHARLKVGPRKAVPLSLLADQAPSVVAELRQLVTLRHLPDYATHFAHRNPGREAPAHLAAVERRVWSKLTTEPQRLSQVVHGGPGLIALRRLADAGLATWAAFTPSDAMHVLGGSRAGTRRRRSLVRSCWPRNSATWPVPARLPRRKNISEQTYELVICESARVVLATALAQDPGIETRAGSWGQLGDRLVADIVAGKPFAQLVRAELGLATPLVAIGAPVQAYYPEVARRLRTEAIIPESAAVCNAVGAVAGVVSQSVDILVNQPAFGVFRVHDPAGIQEFAAPEPAIECARAIASTLALEAARRAGAPNPNVETIVTEQRAQMGAAEYLAEALVRATATGRPFAGHLRVAN